MIITISLLGIAVFTVLFIRIKIGTLHPIAAFYLFTNDNKTKVREYKDFNVPEQRKGNLEVSKLVASPFPPKCETIDFTVNTAGLVTKCRSYKYSPTLTPVVFYFHGGGFCLGNIESHDSICRYIAKESDACVISVDYPLAPEHPFPTAIDTCLALIKQCIAGQLNVEGIDVNRIHLAGDSAGGNIAAVLCHMLRDEQLGENIKSQVLFYPVVDVSHFERNSYKTCGFGYLLEKTDIEIFLQLYSDSIDERKDWRMSPYLHSNFKNLPPACIITAEYDPLQDEGIHYHKKLQAYGNTSIHINARGMVHGFLNATVLGLSRKEIRKAGEFIKSCS